MLNNKQIRRLLGKITDCYETRKQELSGYDAVIGDGDHGYSLARGCNAGIKAIQVLPEDTSIQSYFSTYGRELTNEIGGAIGPLFGMFFTELGKSSSDKEEIGLQELSTGFTNAQNRIVELGGAQLGDKTMIDAVDPVVKALQQSADEGAELSAALESAYGAAKQGVSDTIPLQSRRGRSQYLREKSIGYQDAGATSFSYLIKTILDFVKEENTNEEIY